jgi:hypothetical protein
VYSVSQQYKDAVYAPSRMVKARVTFEIGDPTIDYSKIYGYGTNNFAVSDFSQLYDKKVENTYNIATLENDRFKLDGSFSFADDILANNKLIGYVSDALSEYDGTVFGQVLTFVMNGTYSNTGITLTFDSMNNEYATEFDIKLYNSSDVLIKTYSVTDNTEVQAIVMGNSESFFKVEVVIKKWSNPFRRVRLTEVNFAVAKFYTDDTLINCSLIEEMDVTSSTMPTTEFKFTADNLDRAFNILNPTGLYSLLKERQKVYADLGLELDDGAFEWTPLGTYLLADWTSDEGSMTASFTATSYLDLLKTEDYENLIAKLNYPLYNLAVDLFIKCGIKNYSIDNALKTIYTNALIKKRNCAEVMQFILLAAGANIFERRDGKVIIKVNQWYNMGVIDPIDTILLDDMYEEPKVQLEKQVKRATVTYYSDLSTPRTYSMDQGTSGDTVTLEDNTLLNTADHANTVCNFMLSTFNTRPIYTVNWRGNPAHELNDLVWVDTTFGQADKVIITKQELNYEGYLSVMTEGRSVID